jgi:hypothetical protein
LVKLTMVSRPVDLAGDLQRRLHRIGAGRPRELHPVVETARLQNVAVQHLQELRLGLGVQVERMRDAVHGDVVEKLLLQVRVVVPVVERARAGEKVEQRVTLGVVDPRALALGEHVGNRARVALHG